MGVSASKMVETPVSQTKEVKLMQSQVSRKSAARKFEEEMDQELLLRQSSKHLAKPGMDSALQAQIQNELTSTLSILLRQTNEKKNFALTNFAEAAAKQKELLLQSPLFEQALNQVIL